MTEVLNLWPELMWIKDADLREKTAKTWELALEKSVLTPEDLQNNSFYPACRTRPESFLYGP